MEQSKVSNALSRVWYAVANPGSYDDWPSARMLLGALAIVVEDLTNLRVPAEDQKPEETRGPLTFKPARVLLDERRKPGEAYVETLARLIEERDTAIWEATSFRQESANRTKQPLLKQEELDAIKILISLSRSAEENAVQTLQRIIRERDKAVLEGHTLRREMHELRLEVAKLKADLAMHVDPKDSSYWPTPRGRCGEGVHRLFALDGIRVCPRCGACTNLASESAPVLDLTNHVAMVKNLAAVANDAYVNVSNENLNATCEECWEATVRAVLARYDPHGKALVQEERPESPIASTDCGDTPYTREQLANKLSIAEHELHALRERNERLYRMSPREKC